MLNWDEKRRLEWEIYKKMVKSEYKENQKFYEMMSEKEREEFETEEMKRLEKEKKWEKKLEKYRQQKDRGSGAGSVTSNEDDLSDDMTSMLGSAKRSGKSTPFEGNFMSRAQVQEQIKQKRSKKVAFHWFNKRPIKIEKNAKSFHNFR